MSNGILVIGEIRGGKPTGATLECVSEAAALVGSVGGPVSVALIGPGAAGLAADVGRYGATTVYVLEQDELAVFRSGPYADAAAACISAADPQVVLLPNSADGREIATRCAARLGAGVVNDVTVLLPGEAHLRATHPCFGGSVLAEKECLSALQIFTVRPNSFARVEAGGEAAVVPLTVDFSPSGVLVRVVDVVSERAGVLSLEEASIIVSGGRGLGGPENFALIEELASVMGAAVGASRAAVDAGWKPATYQVGQTGKIVSPDLYVACGISGAIQHKAGMQTSDIIVAINKDPEAPIFKFATFGIVGDLHEIVPALIEEIRRRKAAA
jgi:Electron transfer flavoprotein, alpha subunit